MSTEPPRNTLRTVRLVLIVTMLAMLILCCVWFARLVAIATVQNPS